MGDLPQRPVALLEHGEDDRHRTFASSRSSRTSSGTASGPSPTILPSLRSAGGSSASTSIPPAARATGFVSSGFFFAATMPLSAGERGSFTPPSGVSTEGGGGSATPRPPP